MGRGKQNEPQFAVCIDNRDYPASLDLRKIYRVAPDPAAARHGQIRIVDEKAGIVSRLGAGARAKSALLYPLVR